MTTCALFPELDSTPTGSPASTPSAAGSRAKTSRWLEEVRVLRESEADFGESTPAWLANYDPASSSWRTSGLLPVEDSPTFSETLPRSGWMRNGTLFLLLPLVRLIYATGVGSSPLLPTPLASEAKRSNPPLNARAGTGLTFAAKLLPTPTAGDAKASGSRNTATSNANPGISLTDWARGDGGVGRLLPTPQAQDYRNCADYSDGSRGHSPQLRHLGNGRLNPRFVEWMMGLPQGWTDVDGLDRTEPG